MGIESKKTAPPLPAPTESETVTTPTELATELSQPADEKSSYSLPEDGTPVIIKTRGHQPNRSQTSLLIEYFEGGKTTAGPGAGSDRKPSVRVRLTPSKGRKNDHFQITETKSSRKTSLGRKAAAAAAAVAPAATRDAEALSTHSAGDAEDGKSISSYASATEESNVSRPIDIEIDRGGSARRRRPTSPLIPAADSAKAAYPPPNMSDISAIGPDSFLDGSTSPTKHVTRRSGSPSRAGDVLAGAAAGLAAAAMADKMRSKSRTEERDRAVVSRSSEREKSERRHRSSRSRTSSVGEKDSKTPRRRSSRGHQESTVSAADSSVLSSNLSSHRSADQHSVRSGTSKSSINNPKLLETVEDAIRRLILPELNALKREQSRHKDHRESVTSSGTSVSRDEYASDRRRSSATEKRVDSPRESAKLRERRDREARHDLEASPAHSLEDHDYYEEDTLDHDKSPRRSGGKIAAAAAGAALGGLATAALMEGKSVEDKRQRRRRLRADQRSRASEGLSEEGYEEDVAHEPAPPMPLMSEINPSEVTRTSILSADTERPLSASEEHAREVEALDTPTRAAAGLAVLGAQHANISHGDLKDLPRQRDEEYPREYETDEYQQRRFPLRPAEEYDEEVYDEAAPDAPQYLPGGYDIYDVPAPLNYVPYQPERRALSPIPSVSGYTEGGSERPHRDSRGTQMTVDSISSPEKSPHHGGDAVMHSPSSMPSNVLSRDFDDDRSLRSSGVDQRNAAYADDSELGRVGAGQAIQAVGASNPKFVQAIGVESAVASLVDGSALDDSPWAGSAHEASLYHDRRDSAGLAHEERSRTPTQDSVASQSREVMEGEDRAETPVSRSQHSREFAEEYELDEYGRKVPRSRYRHSPTLSEAAITGAAVGAAAAAIKAAKDRGNRHATVEDEADDQDFIHGGGAGVSRNKSFKQRTMEGQRPANTPTHSIDRFADDYEHEHEQPKLGASGLPDLDDPMPEIGYFGREVEHESEPSIVGGRLDGEPGLHQDAWKDVTTPTQERPGDHYEEEEREITHQPSSGQGHGAGLGIAAAAGAAAIATAAAMASSHSRQPSQEEEWQRTSDDRKRDTLVTNPYEGASPIANLPGLNDNLLQGGAEFTPAPYAGDYAIRSPLGAKVDEGYISDIREPKGKGVGFDMAPGVAAGDDPFYTTPKHNRHLSGMSQGMQSPFYDGATGSGIDRIESKDIIALMQHLMVRDAQRSARDTEILVTLVRSATEMRSTFDEMKKMLIDTEDNIITEVRDNTEKTVRNAIGGPRPFPGSASRSLQGGSQGGTVEDLSQQKKRSIFRRALKGLSSKGSNDLSRIEDMLMQLLTEVDTLKSQTAPGTSASNRDAQSFDNLPPEVQYEQDRGYEPDGNAGTSTASHASQSGHFSIPQARGQQGSRLGYDRKFSDHRISTVPEANEEEYDQGQSAVQATHHYSNPDMLMTPAMPIAAAERGASEPLGTPPQAPAAAQASHSNENTPRTDKGKKHGSWFPKISRWSETTTSSVTRAFRASGRKERDDDQAGNVPSRSGSDLDRYDGEYPAADQYAGDKLHSGFSEPDLQMLSPEDDTGLSPVQRRALTPEEVRYRAKRASLTLHEPQPRQGQTQHFRATLESQAHDFDPPLSPRSADWAGSATSLTRFPAGGSQQQGRQSYGAVTDGSAGHDTLDPAYWASSPAGAAAHADPPIPPKVPLEASPNTALNGPRRPPKEPLLDDVTSAAAAAAIAARGTPPRNSRISKLQKRPNQSSGGSSSPLPFHSVESGYGTATLGGAPSYRGSSPRLENRNLSGALAGGPTRRPSGPRAMTPKSGGGSSGRGEDADKEREKEERRKKRDTFGTISSQDDEIF